ncbi:MAG: guanylate kinase [Caldisericia bacterium]|nr:guanylate kinase [Caldisericia bacterium]
MKKELIVISGPSGVGKKTVVEAVLEKSDQFILSVSATTRKPRTGEVNGVDYHFLTIQQFRKRIKENAFVEWAKVHDQYYGTLIENLEQAKKQRQYLVLEIDVQGAMAIKKEYGEKALLIFILPPRFEDLIIRLRSRGTEAEEEIEKRIETAKLEIQVANEYDYRVINDEVARVAAEIIQIVESSERRKKYEKSS